MAVKLKRLVSEAGAGEDKSFGVSDENPDRFTLLSAIVNTQNDLVAQFNQLKADFDAASAPTSATDVVPGVEVES